MYWRIPPVGRSKPIEPALRSAKVGDTVTISDEAKRKFQEMCDNEIERRSWETAEVIKVEIDEGSVEQPRNSHGDVLFFFSLGSLATVFAASLGYMIFSFVL